MENVKELTTNLVKNIEKVIIGKRRAVQLVVLGLICEGHVLIEDVPGVGKTMLARSLARSLDCSFNRIQCTPDMLPSDITGVEIYDQSSGEFRFLPGPILNQIILADEINRATPKNTVSSSGSNAGTPGNSKRRNTFHSETIHGPGHSEPDRI